MKIILLLFVFGIIISLITITLKIISQHKDYKHYKKKNERYDDFCKRFYVRYF